MKLGNLAAPEEVPDSLVSSAVARWDQLIALQMERAWGTLVDAPAWLFMEAMQFLLDALLLELGVAKPAAVSFSFMNSTLYECDCEVLIVWRPKSTAGFFDPFDVLDDCTAMRMDSFLWPNMAEFLTNEDARARVIKRWAWTISAVVEDMPKGAI